MLILSNYVYWIIQSHFFYVHCRSCIDSKRYVHKPSLLSQIFRVAEWIHSAICICNTFTAQIKGIFSVTNLMYITQFILLVKCSNELSACLVVKHLHVRLHITLPNVLMTCLNLKFFFSLINLINAVKPTLFIYTNHINYGFWFLVCVISQVIKSV